MPQDHEYEDNERYYIYAVEGWDEYTKTFEEAWNF